MMGNSQARGFTLIEVILFLAISGLMLTGVLVGVNGSINRQRYNDATSSLLDYLQSQYGLVNNVRNSRPDNRGCTSAGVSDNSATELPGTSDCTIAGRIISSTDGQNIISRPVYALTSADTSATTDAALFSSLHLVVAPADITSNDDGYKLLWQTSFYTDQSNKSSSDQFAILIVRLPTNGLVRTYARNSYSSLSDFWTSPQANDLAICVNQSGLTNAPAIGISVEQDAATSSGVQQIAAGSGAC